MLTRDDEMMTVDPIADTSLELRLRTVERVYFGVVFIVGGVESERGEVFAQSTYSDVLWLKYGGI